VRLALEKVEHEGRCMASSVRRRFHAEVAGSCCAFALAALTALWPDWIERLFGVDPDKGSGSLEWAVVFATFVLAVVLVIAARADWRRLRMS
jgi:hypothetical protein